MKHTKLNRFAVVLAGSALLGGASVEAANTFYNAGDLVMFIQEQGGTNTVYANLGASNAYRGAVSGPDGTPQLNVLDLSTTLVSAFGANWQTNPNIWVGIAGFVGTSSLSSTLTNGDPQRTIYVSSPRTTASGNIFTQNSSNYLVASGSTGMSNGVSGIGNMLLPYIDGSGVNGYDSQTVISPISISNIDDQNPFLAAGVPGVSFNLFAGGVSQRGTAGDLGTVDYEGIGEVEFALDLHRILARNNISGQVGGPQYASTFEGTFLVDTNGMVHFIPEPSAATLSGLAAALLVLRRRRNA